MTGRAMDWVLDVGCGSRGGQLLDGVRDGCRGRRGPAKTYEMGRARRLQRLFSDRPLTEPRPLREIRVVAVAAGDAVDPHETVPRWWAVG
jgi:hypothetical protein